MKFLSVIPARGGSKGLPGKNIMNLGGRPLLAYSIEAALGSQFIDECYVTTDDSAIRAVASNYGARVLQRPKALAGDQASTSSAVKNVLDQLEVSGNNEFTHLVLLQPTSPLRSHIHVDGAIALYVQENSSSLMSMTEVDHHPYKDFVVRQDGVIEPLFGDKYLSMPRQKLPDVLRQNGAIYIISIKKFRETLSFYSPPVSCYMMDKSSSLDIDTLDDLRLAEYFIGDSLEY